MKDRTTIQIKKETLKRLLKSKKYSRETYDTLVNRLLRREIRESKKVAKQ